jgi:hypothetical protein
MGASSNLEFRATVRFLLDRVPHHATGTWQTGKKNAMRDAAERAVALFVTRWGDVVAQTSQDPLPLEGGGVARCIKQQDPEVEQGVSSSDASRTAATLEIAQELERYCLSLSSHGQTPILSENSRVRWIHKQDNQGYVAFADLELVGVTHTFCGPRRNSLADACEETSRRLLWYLQCPGFEDTFDADLDFDIAKDIPEAPKDWIRQDAPENEAKEEAEEKTAVMRLQNRLQQAYAKQIAPKTSAITWNIEKKSSMVCATAYIPAIGKDFTSEWRRGQRDAKIDACKKVSKFLDENPPEHWQAGRNRNGTLGSGSSGP